MFKTPMTLELYDRVELAVQDGWSFREISRTFNISRDSIRRWFRGKGWDEAGVLPVITRNSNTILDEAFRRAGVEGIRK